MRDILNFLKEISKAAWKRSSHAAFCFYYSFTDSISSISASSRGSGLPQMKP